MAKTSTFSSRSTAPTTSTKPPYRGRTRHSVFGTAEYLPPYDVRRIGVQRKGIVHSGADFHRYTPNWLCCRANFEEDTVFRYVEQAPTCLTCVLCIGCPACRDNHVRPETMALGKWVTKDGRALYPFEMDPTHLMNSIAKLKRDRSHFKDNWETWVVILEAEACLRGMGS